MAAKNADGSQEAVFGGKGEVIKTERDSRDTAWIWAGLKKKKKKK